MKKYLQIVGLLIGFTLNTTKYIYCTSSTYGEDSTPKDSSGSSMFAWNIASSVLGIEKNSPNEFMRESTSACKAVQNAAKVIRGDNPDTQQGKQGAVPALVDAANGTKDAAKKIVHVCDRLIGKEAIHVGSGNTIYAPTGIPAFNKACNSTQKAAQTTQKLFSDLQPKLETLTDSLIGREAVYDGSGNSAKPATGIPAFNEACNNVKKVTQNVDQVIDQTTSEIKNQVKDVSINLKNLINKGNATNNAVQYAMYAIVAGVFIYIMSTMVRLVTWARKSGYMQKILHRINRHNMEVEARSRYL